jgi:hypothetical protein
MSAVSVVLIVLAVLLAVAVCIGVGIYLVINYLCGSFWRDLSYIATKQGR